ncbi:hypothetical protein BDZ97DRAFT_1924303 [Flammula alnicola]|nr:hypothetical protein BDZ97DRAFT_1924303 [Flammula alnicola]
MPSDDEMELDEDEEQEIEPRSPFDEEFPNNYNHLEDETDGDFQHPKMPHESDGSGSDYEETEKEAQRRRIGRSKCRVASASPTIEEQDAEDDQDFDQLALRTPPSPPRIKSHQKGKWKAAPTEIHDHNGDHDSDTPQRERQTKKKAGPSRKADHQSTVRRMNHLSDVEDDDEPMGREYSSGPIPSAAKEAAYSAHNEFIQKLEDLATEYNKPVKHFLSLVGREVPLIRKTSAWDAFQRWYPAHVKKNFYSREMATLKATLGDKNPTREDIEKHFQVQLAFYKESLENWLTQKKGDKKFAGVVSRVLEPFIRWSTQVSEEYGIHIFGCAVETSHDSCSSVAWGRSSEYKYLRDQHATVIKTQLHDYEGLFKVAEMRHRKLGQIGLSSLIDTRKKPNENPRDHMMTDLMAMIARISAERQGDSEDSSRMKSMSWSWTDFAYKNELRIMGWGKGTPFPKDAFDPKHLKVKPLKNMVQPRIVSYEQFLEREDPQDDDEEDLDGVVHIVSWTEAERKMCLKDKRSILLVLDIEGTTLSTVFDCKMYIRALHAIGETSTNANYASKPKRTKKAPLEHKNNRTHTMHGKRRVNSRPREDDESSSEDIENARVARQLSTRPASTAAQAMPPRRRKERNNRKKTA